MPESQQSEVGTQLILNKILANPKHRVLDVGAGEGKWGKLLKDKVDLVDGIEVWKPYIAKYTLHAYYNALYNIDIREFKFDKEYDVVILGDVLEHLQREEAVNTLNYLKSNVSKIYLTLPITICIQDGNYYGNPFETHHYHWSDKEVRWELGFNLLNVSVNDNGLVAIGCYEWIK